MTGDILRVVEGAVRGAGVCAWGIVRVCGVDEAGRAVYERMLDEGLNGDMTWMSRHQDVRNNPAMLLEGAQTMICCAFDYTPVRRHRYISDYALPALDYHESLRRTLTEAAETICRAAGGSYRICIDSAPLRERYWAEKAGIGSIGYNQCLYVPGTGSKVFLAEILLTARLEDYPTPEYRDVREICRDCGRCAKVCPTGALDGNGGCDYRKCLSYITIENRAEELPGGLVSGARKAVGCDMCIDVCPLNHRPESGHQRPETLAAKEEMYALGLAEMATISDEKFREIFGKTAVARLKPFMLRRNCTLLLENQGKLAKFVSDKKQNEYDRPIQQQDKGPE